jgi:capsular exopolysaccharide synthesis family protein
MQSEQVPDAAPGRWSPPVPQQWRAGASGPEGGGMLDMQRWLAVFRRHERLFLIVAAVIFAAFLVKTLSEERIYTAHVEIAVDPRREQIVDAKPVVQDLARSTQEANIVDTQVALLHSRRLAARVVRRLNLAKDPEFNRELSSAARLRARIANLTQRPGPRRGREVMNNDKVISALLDRVEIRRRGLTYVIGIDVSSNDPAKAAKIANAYANNFLSMDWDTKADATRRVNAWVSGRLEGLRQEVERRDTDVQNYKIANNLLSSSGVPLNEAEISNYNQQAATARAALAEDLARLRTSRAQLARGSSGDDLGEALGSEVVLELRKHRAAISTRYANLESRYGPRHPELLKAKEELADVDAQIQAEIRRIISNLEAKVEVSRQRLASVEGTLNSARGVLAGNIRATVGLNELQRNADAARTIYQTFLDRYKETTAMAGMVAPDARLVSWASIPANPSSPNLKMNLALGALVALMGGLSATMLAEMFHSGLSTAEDVEDKTGAPCLGSVPLLRSAARRTGSPSAYLLSKPRSAFAEAFKVLQISLLQFGAGALPRVLAVTSSLPGEGKTVTSACFAGCLAQQGYKTILVDCDEQRASLSGRLGAGRLGLIEVLQGRCTLEEAVVHDERTGTSFLPLIPSVDAPPDLLMSDVMTALLQRLRREYEIVILDAKPVLGFADTRVVARHADAVVLVAQWRKTPRKAIETSLKILDRSGASIAGVVLSQVDMKQQTKSGYGDPAYYSRRYNAYYTE